MGAFIREYGDELKRFKAPGQQQHSVILLIDNDSGAKPVTMQ